MRSLDKERAAMLSEEMNIPSFLAMMLEIRGVKTAEEAQKLLKEDVEFIDPFSFKDMEEAVARIHNALDNFEKIAVYGDYDADGVTATAILYSYLETCGGNVIYYIPEREGEGYGMNKGAIKKLANEGVTLIVTVDNGISSIEEVDYAKELGIDVIVTDHHRPHEQLPKAVAVVDSYRKDCQSVYKNFCGAGVALHLVLALEGEKDNYQNLLENYADLAAIGTLGDVVPLKGENRSLVKTGLRMLARSDRPGMRALLSAAGMQNRELNSEAVTFTVVPRINATGRMGSSDRAVRLLVTEDFNEAQSIAEEICKDNTLRRETEQQIMRQAEKLLDDNPLLQYDRVLIISGENWHHGVVGIVASRITERFGKPCIIISKDGEEARGSGRSIEGFSLFDAICSCKDLFERFGGHPMAVGLSMKSADIPELRRRVNLFAAQQEMPMPQLTIDCRLNPAALRIEMPEYLKYLEPFGAENPLPLFGLYNMRICEIAPISAGKHLRLTLERGGHRISCLQFRTTLQEFLYSEGDMIDVAVTLQTNEFRGSVSLSIIVQDSKPSKTDMEEILKSYRIYEKFRREERLSDADASELKPSREDFAAIYRFLRVNNGWHGDAEALLIALKNPSISAARFLMALDILAERGLIAMTREVSKIEITLCPISGKTDLTASPILHHIEDLCKG